LDWRIAPYGSGKLLEETLDDVNVYVPVVGAVKRNQSTSPLKSIVLENGDEIFQVQYDDSDDPQSSPAWVTVTVRVT